MAPCPRCGRPAASSGARCLYCGAERPADAAAPDVPPTPLPEPPARTLVVVELRAAPAEALADALGLSPYEAARRAERGGFHLHRIAAPAEAEAAAERLTRAGVRPWLVPEAAVRAAARPRPVRGGRPDGRALLLQVGDETLRVSAAELLLVVRGPVVREYQSVAKRQRVRAASLEGGHRVHLHGRADGPPLELDPGDFEFADRAGVIAPTLLVLSGWLEALGPDVPVDDDFRRLPPALGPEETSRGALGLAEALRPPRRSDAPLLLDNLAQFRFYSAWRAIVERRRRATSEQDGGGRR
jgi:hypothetical protein